MTHKKFFITTTIFSLTFGCISHFFYDWNKNKWIGRLFPKNESIWEHTKLIFTPSFIISLLYLLIGDKKIVNTYLKNRLQATIIAIIFQITFFKTYTKLLKIHHLLPLDITDFITTTLTLQILTYLITKNKTNNKPQIPTTIITWTAILIAYITLSDNPPNHPLFKEN